jgi:hypothetical protein
MATAPRTTGYVEFGPIVAGSILACAISVVLIQFGTALGLAAAKATYYQGNNFLWRVIAISLWLLWVQITASMIGGYIAGRMREPVAGATAHESEMRDGVHGLLVWATSTLMTVIASAVSAYFNATANIEPQVSMQVSEELAKKSGIILGFILSASSLIAALAAWWAATVGGDHRDRSVDFSKAISFKKHR